MFRALVLHRAWIPAVVLITAAVFVPRARETTNKMSNVSRAVGVYGWSASDSNEFGTTRFRWMKPLAALHEPVRGRTIAVPLFVGRPGIEKAPIVVSIEVEGVQTTAIALQRQGWQTATFDLPELLGETEWKSLTSVTLAFQFSGLTADVRLPIVGLGDVHWTGPPPR